MAPIADDNTARLWVDYSAPYTGGQREHTVMMRYSGTDRSATAAQTRMLSWLNGITAAQFVSGWQVLRVRTALAGETFSLTQEPIAGLLSFVGSTGVGVNAAQSTVIWTWQARSTSGPRRASLMLFGLLPQNETASGRVPVIPGGGVPWVNNSVAALNAASSPLVAIDGSALLWYPYINTSRNSYWERRIRVG